MAKKIPIDELKAKYQDGVLRGGRGLDIAQLVAHKSQTEPLPADRAQQVADAQRLLRSAYLRLTTQGQRYPVLSSILAVSSHIVAPTEYVGLSMMGGDGFTAYYNDFIIRYLASQPQSAHGLNWLLANQAMRLAYRVFWDKAPYTTSELYPNALEMFISCEVEAQDPKFTLMNDAALRGGLKGPLSTPEHEIWNQLLSDPMFMGLAVPDQKYRGKPLPYILADMTKNNVKPQIAPAGNTISPPQQQQGQGGQTLSSQSRQLQLTSVTNRAIAIQRKIKKGSVGDHSGDGNGLLWESVVPKVPWHKLLGQRLEQIFRPGADMAQWHKLHRSSQCLGQPMPTYISQSVGGLLIQVDVSGSALYALSQFLSEIGSIVRRVKPAHVTVIYTTVAVVKVQHFLPRDYGTIAEQIAPAGDGGTDMVAGYRWLMNPMQRPGIYQNLEYAAIITLTDGETPVPKKGVEEPRKTQSFWIIDGSEASQWLQQPEFGTSFYMDIRDTHVEEDD